MSSKHRAEGLVRAGDNKPVKLPILSQAWDPQAALTIMAPQAVSCWCPAIYCSR